MSDLTVMFLTANQTPEGWNEFQRGHLTHAAKGHELITVSRKPTRYGDMNLIDTDTPGYRNIYRQMLRAAKIARTPFVAMAEDDTLYSREHFNCFRPKADEFAYDRSRWSVFTFWQPELYSLRQRISNCSLIAPRELLIEALEERFAKHPGDTMPLCYCGECGRNVYERRLGITERKSVDFFSEVAIVQLSHPNGAEPRQKKGRKKHAQIKAYDIPYWGKAVDIVKKYDGREN